MAAVLGADSLRRMRWASSVNRSAIAGPLSLFSTTAARSRPASTPTTRTITAAATVFHVSIVNQFLLSPHAKHHLSPNRLRRQLKEQFPARPPAHAVPLVT